MMRRHRKKPPADPAAFGNVTRLDPALPPAAAPPPCRTLDDMSRAEIAALERQYRCKVMSRRERQRRDQAAADAAAAAAARAHPEPFKLAATAGGHRRR